MTLSMRRVFSSHISAIGYDPEERTLVVHFTDGSKVAYDGVEAGTARQVETSPSIGKALHQFIKYKHSHRYL